MSSLKSMEVHVIAWPGKEDSAQEILSALRNSRLNATVFYARSGENTYVPPDDWIVVEGFGYGRIFQASLEQMRSDVLLHIHSDCVASNWPAVARRAFDVFSADHVGVWSPIVDWSFWSLSRTQIGRGTLTRTRSVTTVDGIVWAFTSAVAKRLRSLDFSVTPKGWGIDVAACAIARKSGSTVLMDKSIKVRHPRGSGYKHAEAEREAEKFAQQLDPLERLLYEDTFRTAQNRISEEKSALMERIFGLLRRWTSKFFASRAQ